MERYIELPKDKMMISEIESFFLEFFFKFMNVEVKENKIDILYLEKYYQFCKKQNKIENFKKTLNELVLRGFILHFSNRIVIDLNEEKNKENTFVLKSNETEVFITSNPELNSLIYNYHIKEKKFFDNIDLNYFLKIFKEFDIKMLKEEFEKNKIQVIELKNKTLEKNRKNERLINEFFYENFFENFREFCNKESVRIVEQLTMDILKKYRSLGGVGEKKYLTILSRIEELKEKRDYSDINQLFSSISLDESSYNILEKRYLFNMTLSDIGADLKLTRQGINLRLDKLEEKLKSFFKFKELKKYLREISISNKWISLRILEKIIENKNRLFLEILKAGNIIEYNEDLEIFILENEINEKINKILEIIYSIKSLKTLEEIYELINNEDIDHELFDEILTTISLENILKNLEFRRYGEYYINKKLTNTEILEIILKEYIERGIYLDNEGIDKIKKIAKNKFDLELEISERSLINSIYSQENIFLCGPKEYIHKSKINYSEIFIEKIYLYIKSFFKKYGDVLNIDFLFREFRKECEKEKIWSKQLLYSVLKYEYEDEFIFGKGNTLNIYRDESKVSREEQLSNYLKNNKKVDTKINILNGLKWKLYQLEDTIYKSKNFIPIDNKVALKEYINLNENEQQNLFSKINLYLRGNFYYSTEKLFQNLLKEEDIKIILNKYGLKNSKALSYFLRVNNLINDYKFINKLMFLVLKESDIETVEDLIKLEFRERKEIERRELKDFYKDLGYKEAMISSIDSKLIEKQIFLEIDKNKVVLNENFKIDENNIQKVKNFLEDKIKNKKYLVLNDLEFKVLNIKNKAYNFNPYIIKSLLLKYKSNYKFLKKIASDYRYDKIILVRKEEEFEVLEDLIYFLLKNKYRGFMEEKEVYNYLSEEGLVSYKEYDYDKKLFQSFKDGIYNKIYVDLYGKVYIR